jgi:DNA-binding transcriptional ArsR family regulator
MIGAIDQVFKALANPTRRSLLDELLRHDGQTLGTLEQPRPMTRSGVMKHLRLLEDADLHPSNPGRFSLAVQPGAPSSRSASSTIRPSGPRT